MVICKITTLNIMKERSRRRGVEGKGVRERKEREEEKKSVDR